jgi:hypothetical protein
MEFLNTFYWGKHCPVFSASSFWSLVKIKDQPRSMAAAAGAPKMVRKTLMPLNPNAHKP